MQSFEASAPQAYKYLDNSSKLSEQNVLTGNLTYQYDLGTGRFISSNQASYSYETTTALPMSGRGQQTQSYAFNELGQRTRSLVGTSSATLGWSGERLTSFETSDTSAHYVYDSSGMRTQSSVTHLGSTSDTKYAYDGLRLMELSQNGANPYRIGYLYEDQNSTPYAASYETSETALSFTLESNVRGDVIALRDTLGNVFATYSYGDYGEPQAITTNETELVSADLAKDLAERQALRYAGYLYDDYSGMYYCAARYYDPATQVFISLDPVRADGERSGYLYCNGDPINSVDLSGLWAASRHRNLTYQCAKAVGIKEYAALWLAVGSEATDNIGSDAVTTPNYHFNFRTWLGSGIFRTPETATYGLVKGGDLRNEHYKTRRRNALEIIKGHALKNKTKTTMRCAWTFGFGLHSVQDAYAHGNITPANHQLPKKYKNIWDDYSKDYQKRCSRVVSFTKKELAKFKKDAKG